MTPKQTAESLTEDLWDDSLLSHQMIGKVAKALMAGGLKDPGRALDLAWDAVKAFALAGVVS